MENESYVDRQSIKYINTFLYRCGRNIDEQLLPRLFDLGLNKTSYHNSNFFNALLDIIKIKDCKVGITEKQLAIIKNLAFEKCLICSEKHPDSIIVPLYQIIKNRNYKNEIGEIVLKKLEEDFSFDLFYQATIFDLIPLDTGMLGKAIKLSVPKSSKASFKSALSGIDDNRFDNVNAILNICFKYNIDTTTKQFQPFKNLDAYYSWLVDMDSFNYDHFEPNWIGEHATKFYYKKIYSNRLVKEKLDFILKEKFDSNIERNYLNIYVRKNWEG